MGQKGPLADCPYCKGRHRTKKAFNQCKRKHHGYKWTKDGKKV